MQHRQCQVLQHVELYRNLLWQITHHFLLHGGPGDAVGGATSYMVNVDIVGDANFLQKVSQVSGQDWWALLMKFRQGQCTTE